MDNRNKRAICVKNLPSTITKEELLNVFGKFGNCVSCDLNVDSISAYIEFESEQSVEKALAMDVEMGYVISCNQATDQRDSATKSYVTSQKPDNLKPIQIFIGGIGSNVDENVLREGFSKFGKIVEVKVVRQADGTHKGYAFVSYTSESEAGTAINTMNNTMFHNKKIQCNWAAKNNPIANSHAAINGSNSWEFVQTTTETIATDPLQSSTSVYVVAEHLTEEILKSAFAQFGKIKNIKSFPEKNHAFINYESHDSAANAIQQMHGKTINNNIELKCSWGKKSSDQIVVYNPNQIYVNNYPGGYNPIANSHAAINGSNSWEFGQKTTETIATDPLQSSTSVYVVAENLTEEILKSAFTQFGKIKNIKSFPEKNHAFVNYESHDSAANAIQQMHGKTINNNIELKCSWGKKSSDQNGVFNPNQIYVNNYPGGQFGQFYAANYAMGQYMGQQYGMANAARVAPMVPGYYSNMQFGGTLPQQNRFQSHAKPLNNIVANRQMRTNHPYRLPQTPVKNQVGANTNSSQQNQLQ